MGYPKAQEQYIEVNKASLNTSCFRCYPKMYFSDTCPSLDFDFQFSVLAEYSHLIEKLQIVYYSIPLQ